MSQKKKTKKRQYSLSELIAQDWRAEYETLTWQRAEIVDSDAAAKSVQFRMIIRGLYALVLTTIAIIWLPWTILYVWGSSSSMRLWALPPPPVPSIATIQTGLFVAGLTGLVYYIMRLSALRRTRIAPAARSADLAASAASDRANSASSA